MFGLGKRQPTVGINPAGLRLRHIDIELAKLAVRERTDGVRLALDFWLDRRNSVRHGGEGGAW